MRNKTFRNKAMICYELHYNYSTPKSLTKADHLDVLHLLTDAVTDACVLLLRVVSPVFRLHVLKQKTKMTYDIPIELDFPKIAENNSKRENPVYPIAKISSRKTQKNRQAAKLNSCKNLVLHGILIPFPYTLDKNCTSFTPQK